MLDCGMNLKRSRLVNAILLHVDTVADQAFNEDIMECSQKEVLPIIVNNVVVIIRSSKQYYSITILKVISFDFCTLPQ